MVEAGHGCSADSGRDVRLVIIGDGSQRAAIAGAGRRRAEHRLRRPAGRRRYPLALAAADLLLVNERAGVGDMSLPSKLTSYLAAGRPVLAAVGDGRRDLRELARTDGAAITVPPGDPHAFVDGVRALNADPERCARMAAARPSPNAWASRPATARSMQSPTAPTMLVHAPLPPTRPASLLRSFTGAGYDKGRSKALAGRLVRHDEPRLHEVVAAPPGCARRSCAPSAPRSASGC